MPSDRAFVSSRLPMGLRDRLKAFAVANGESVQRVVERAVTRLLEDEALDPPQLATVLRKVRGMEHMLRDQGVTGAWVFGSVARGDVRPDSDVDLALDIDPDRHASLLMLARLQQQISDVLGTKVDIGLRCDLRPQVAEAFRRDAVQVF